MSIDCTRAGWFNATRKRDEMCRTETDRRDRADRVGECVAVP
jgi:hypothetical protein